MTSGILRTALPLCFVFCVARTENRALLREEEERRWNTPPELIPEEVVRRSETTNEQLRSLIAPITTNINIGAGENSHSLGLQLGLESVSLSQGNAFSQPLYGLMGPSLSGSQSTSFSAGFTGISAASSQSFGYNGPILGTQGKAESQSFNFGKPTASSVTSSASSHASSGVQSSVSFAQSAASSGHQTGSFSDGATVNVHRPGRQQIRPTWTNISPNYGPNDRQSPVPTLKVDVRPSGTRNQRPVTLQISSRPTNRRDQKPMVQIYKPRLDGMTIDDRSQWSKGESVVTPGLQIAVVGSPLQQPGFSSNGGIDIRGMNLRWPEK